MPELSVSMTVTKPKPATSVISIKGDVTAVCEEVLMDAFQEAVTDGSSSEPPPATVRMALTSSWEPMRLST
jgi:hypothetical protein